MTKACLKTSVTSTTKGASVLFFGFHWSFTILEPSGKGWPLPGKPALYASIMVGLATITLSTSSVRAEETTAQSSYPLKSENAIPLGDFSEYLSCAETAVPPKITDTDTAVAMRHGRTLGMVTPPLAFACQSTFLGRPRLLPEILLLDPSSVNDGYPGGRHIP